MKKSIYNLIILAVAGTGFIACESSNKTIDDVFDGVTRGAVFRATTPALEIAAQTFSFSDPNSTFAVSFEVEDHEQGALLDNVDVYTTFKSNADPSLSVSEVLVRTIPASAFTPNTAGLPSINFVATLGELATAAGLSPGDYTGGDSFNIRFVLKLTDGRTFSSNNLNSTVSGGSFFRSPFNYNVPLVCPPIPPTPGTWTINMQDSYGDGWQTTNGDAGDPITITLNDGTVFRVGLCSPYLASDFDCTPGVSSGSTTIEIPVGTTSAEWTFPGDFFGEISFQIVTPNGNVAADISANAPAGPIAIDFCVD